MVKQKKLYYNKIKKRKQRERLRKETPWVLFYQYAKWRCKNLTKKYYYNMEFTMTVEDFKELWFRDKAYLLEQPSIDRINDKVGYVKSNCRFVELQDNTKNHKNF